MLITECKCFFVRNWRCNHSFFGKIAVQASSIRAEIVTTAGYLGRFYNA